MKKIISSLLVFVLCAGFIATVSAQGISFVDVPENGWYYEDVKYAVEQGLINGKTENTFCPDDMLTYAEAIKLAACMNQMYNDGAITLSTGNPWYKPYVDYCMDKGIIDKEYNYNENATRAGYMSIFAMALPDEAYDEINSVPTGSIPDVLMNASYAESVYKLYRAGIVAGVDSNHSCSPEVNIKRAEVATIVTRMMDESKRVTFDMPGAEGELKNDGKLDMGKPDNSEKENKTEEVKKEFETEKKTEEKESESIIISGITIDTKHESIVVTPGISEKPVYDYDYDNDKLTLSPLTIYKQPDGLEADEYGAKAEFEVQVYGGKAPYSYQWFYYIGYRNETAEIENSDYVEDATSAVLKLSIEKENVLLGKKIYCEITDSEGEKVKTDGFKVYGPFSMDVEQSLIDSGKNTLVGRVADGVLKKGDKISVERNGKIIAIGTVADLKMFEKSMDETVKGENVGIEFDRSNGVMPTTGDVVIKHQENHQLDLSDIVN